MTYVSKFRSAGGRVVAVYTCPVHGEFDLEVEREPNGDAPDSIQCPWPIDDNSSEEAPPMACQRATWTPTPVTCRVRRIEAVKGKWERPERKTYLDTRELGEGMSMEEFQAKRKAVWEEKRKADVMAVKRGF
jgi:hypothetical protein